VTTRWLAFVVSAAVAVGAGTWALRLFEPAGNAPSRTSTFVPADSAPLRTNMVDPAVPTSSDQTRGIGAYYLPPATPMVAPVTTGDRFKLVGVVAPRVSVAGSEWIALIAVDGEPARAFGVGATVEGDIVLREVSERGAILGLREGSVRIGLDVLPAPAAGMAQVPPARSGLESPDVVPGHGSRYLPLPPQTASEPEKPAAGPLEPDDGRWRPPSRQ
jgi:general secretion pathway protein C